MAPTFALRAPVTLWLILLASCGGKESTGSSASPVSATGGTSSEGGTSSNAAGGSSGSSVGGVGGALSAHGGAGVSEVGGAAGTTGGLGGNGATAGGGSSAAGGAGAEGGTSQGSSGMTGVGGSTTGPCASETAVGACYPTDPTCGIIGSSCMARVENCESAIKTFRLTQLRVDAPAVLASSLVEFTILQPGLDLPNPVCNFSSSATGSFNWLLSVDTAQQTLKTGGADPASDPSAGYCYLTQTFGGGTVQPAEAPYSVDQAGTISMAAANAIPHLTVPIFANGDVPPTEEPILLPLSQVVFSSLQLSDNGNCIGKYDGDTLSTQDACAPATANPKLASSFQWTDGATVTGYITLEDADHVTIVSDNNITLCVLLTGESDPNDATKCPRDASGSLTVTGDTSSIEHPGSMDAYGVSATFAASAIKVNGDCP